MPKTAAAVEQFALRRPAELSDDELETLRSCLDEDLPGAMDFIERAARWTADRQVFGYLSQSPDDMGGKAAWNVLVGYLARLFASPFAAIAHEYVRRQHGVTVAFVNCCIVAAWPGDIDEDELWCLQARMQRTPDC